MSDNSQQGQQQGRTPRQRPAVARLREEREREQATEKRKRGVKAAVLVAAVLAVVGVVGYAATGGSPEKGDGQAAAPITEGKGAAPVTLTVYEDFRCPGCAQFEQAFKDTVHELTDEGKIQVEYHLVTIIDGNMGGTGSTKAANAAHCAADAGKFTPYHDLLYTEQPPEQKDAFGDEGHLIELAGKVEGLDTPAFRSCVREGTHEARVRRTNDAFLGSEYNATPTVLLDGENVYGDPSAPLTPESLRAKVAAAAEGA